MDVVYISHFLESIGAKEEVALQEYLRVTKHAVALIEPIYELSTPKAQAQMRYFGYVWIGYVWNLKAKAESLGANVVKYRLIVSGVASNPLNPSGVIIHEKLNSKITISSLKEFNLMIKN